METAARFQDWSWCKREDTSPYRSWKWRTTVCGASFWLPRHVEWQRWTWTHSSSSGCQQQTHVGSFMNIPNVSTNRSLEGSQNRLFCRSSTTARAFIGSIDVIWQELIPRSSQLPHIPVTAFTQIDLFLVRIYPEFRSPQEPQWQLQSQARTNVDMSTVVDMFTWGRIVSSLPKRAQVDWN